jgi:hypothetical protein
VLSAISSPAEFHLWGLWAWLLPTLVLGYKLLTYSAPPTSVLAPETVSRFSYFFVIQPRFPTLREMAVGADVFRVLEQMLTVAPFYSGVAYSIGAFAAKHDFFGILLSSSSPTEQEDESAPDLAAASGASAESRKEQSIH